MARYTGGIISKTGITPTNSSASGIWSLSDHARFVKASTWPGVSLFAFTSFTFTNGGQTGPTGPTLSTLLSNYNTTTYPWLTNNANFNVVTQGVQQWTVPSTGTYRIRAAGAQGGYNTYNGINGGYGADHQIDVYLTTGTILNIVVGQAGTHNGSTSSGSGGGGGSFVYTGSIGGNGLIIASGGGGGTDDSTSTYTQEHGISTGGSSARSDLRPTYNYGYVNAYTNNGQDGYFNVGSNLYGPGAGWLNDTYSRGVSYGSLTEGRSVTSPNWQGGGPGGPYTGRNGGFGGGGCDYDDGGAGGGFTGGSTDSGAGGGAGGSYYAGLTNAYYTSTYGPVASNYLWLGWNGQSGGGKHGFVSVTKL